MIMMTLSLQVLILIPVWCLMGPLGTANSSSTEVQALNIHVDQLEQRLAALESHSRTQEQKYAAVLQSVLSKLTSTTDELVVVKKELTLTTDELSSLKNDHNTSLRELSAVKDELHTLRDTNLTSIKSMLGKFNETRLTSIESQILHLTSDFNTTLAELHTTETELKDQEILKTELIEIQRNLSLLWSLSHENRTKSPAGKEYPSGGVVFQATQIAGTDIDYHNPKHPPTTVIVFEHSVVNEGNGYDITTGKFTAPVTGVYMFWANHLSRRDYVFHVVREGLNMATSDDPNSKDERTMTAMLVKQGEHVWCQVTSSRVQTEGSSKSYFGGFLVQATEPAHDIPV